MSIRSEQLLPASFRGVPFEVTSGSLRAGRRTVVHEYPQRDKPYVEDLGKATRQITIEAFVVGDDYIARGTALLAEIEKPGSGALIHPWLGEMTVTVTSVSELKFGNGRRHSIGGARGGRRAGALGGQQVRRLDRSIDRFRVHRRGAFRRSSRRAWGGRRRGNRESVRLRDRGGGSCFEGARAHLEGSEGVCAEARRGSRAVEVGNDGDGVEPGGEAAQEPGFG